MLTARAEESERIVGLEIGADDYLAKPFSPNELVARVRALLRRAQRAGAARPGTPITVRADRRRSPSGTPSRSTGGDVTLTAKEFLLLEYLLQHRGRVLSRDVLLTDVWGYRYTGGTRTVDVHVRRLREKLPLLADALVTVKQFGYKLLEIPTPATDATTDDCARDASRPSSSSAALLAAAIALAVAGAAVRDDDARGGPTSGSSRRSSPKRGWRRTSSARGARRPTDAPSRARRRSRPHRRSCSARASRSSPPTAASSATRRRRSRRVAPMENHASRPEVVEARAARPRASAGGTATRSTSTCCTSRCRSRIPAIAFVRVALPLTDVRQQLRRDADRDADGARPRAASARRPSRWMFSARIGQRVRAIADVARPLPRRRSLAAAARLRRRRARARSRGRSTTRCRSSGGGSPSRRAIARAWKRSSPA